MPVGMTDILKSRSDFYFLNVYYTFGFMDMYNTPNEAYNFGVALYVALYAVVLLLIGIPAYVDESCYLMTAPGPGDEAGRRWHRGYNWVALIQITQMGVAEAFTLFGVAMAQLFVLLNDQSPELLPLYAPGCQLRENVTNTRKLETVALLMSSCQLMERSVMGCELQSLFSSPHRLMLNSILMMTLLVPVYTISFGKSISTHCTLGRLQLALMILCCCTLSLHFGAASKFKGVMERISGGEGSWKLQSRSTGSNIFFACINSLGIGNFGITVLGSRVGDRVRQNFVLLAAAICFSDFGISNILFNAVNTQRRYAVDEQCSFSSSEQYDSFMKLNKSATEFGNSRMLEVAGNGVTETAESILMFRDASGYVPWTVFLPYQMMVLVLTTMLICNSFYICDLQTATVFKESKCSIILISSARLGLLSALEFLHWTGSFPAIERYVISGTMLTFYVLRMAQCVLIHLRQGFSEFLLEKRRLIPTENYIQQFAFDWYIGPAIFYLYNIGYPLMFTLAVLRDGEELFSGIAAIFYAATNLLPSMVMIAVSHMWRL